MLEVALTGCRFSGKTVVGRLFKQIGVPVFEADTVLKFILNFKPQFDTALKANVGEFVYSNGFLDPNFFITDSLFDRAIDVVEFELFNAWERFKEKNKKSAYVIFESSIIFERGYKDKFDSIICVFTPKDERVYRYKMNSLENTQSIYNLLSTEIPEFDKNSYSNHIIHNYESGPDILQQINVVDKKIIDSVINNNRKKPQMKLIF